jgi:predicted ATPase/signal transduction histidine kinase
MADEETVGLTVAQYLATRGPVLTSDEFTELALSMASRVAELHASGWVHGELGPASFVLSSRGESEGEPPKLSRARVILTESSRATRIDATPRSATEVDGPLLYVAPERTGRMQTPFDHRADLYSLGATFYEMLTGAPPFPWEDPIRVLQGHVAIVPRAPARVSASIPVPLSDLTMRLLEKMPEHRYQTASAVVDDLRAIRDRLRHSGGVGAFEIGRTDPGRRLGAPRALYGRAREERALRAALVRCTEGSRELVLVGGPAGIGKTALVNHVFSQHRWLGSRKFEALGPSRPFATIADAVDDLLGRLLDAPVELRAQLSTRVRGALGGQGRALLSLIPNLESFTGTLPPLAQLEFSEGDPRTRLALRALIGALAGPDSPVVLSFDDLHWADPTSIDFVKSLVSAEGVSHLVIVGAFRPDAVPEGHPISRSWRESAGAGVSVSGIELSPLDQSALTALCADFLCTDEATIAPLAAVVAEKATGNPLFVERFLRQLKREGLVRVDVIRRTCTYSLPRIAASDLSADVVELMKRAIDLLPVPIRHLLAVAACFRGSFLLEDLSRLIPEPPEDLEAYLVTARAEGMLVPAVQDRSHGYRFAHDRVKQAAYARLDDELRERTHLSIGLQIIERIEDPNTDDRLFEVVDHLGRAERLLRTPAERLRLADLYRTAALRAKASSDFGAAYGYFRSAMALLPEDAHHTERALFVELLHGATVCGFLSGEVESADRLSRESVALLSNPIDRAETLRLRALGLTAADRLEAAVACVREASALLGCVLPASEDQETVRDELRALGERLSQLAPGALEKAPKLEDQRLLLLMRILAAANAPTWLRGDATLFAAAQARKVAITLDHGVTEESGGALVRFGAMYADVLGDPSPAYEISVLGLALALKSKDLRTHCRARFGMAFHMSQFRLPLRRSVEEFRAIADLGTDCGEYAYVGYASHRGIEAALTMGLELPAVLREIERASGFAHRYELVTILTDLSMLRGVVRCMQGEAITHDLLTSSSEDFLRTRPELLARLNVWMLEVAYLFRRPELAARHARSVEPLLQTMPSTLPVMAYAFYDAMARAAWPELTEPREQAPAIIEAHAARLELWAKSSPDNFAHKALLVRAELARVRGRNEEALQGYADAAAAARAQDALVDEATAYDLAARLHSTLGQPTMARGAVQKAMQLFARWGSLGKVDALAAEFLELSEKPSSFRSRASEPSAISASHLDLLSLIKMVEDVSGELVPERLFERLVALGLEIASAQTATLVLREGEDYEIRASGTAAERAVLLRASLEEATNLPKLLVRSVLARASVVIVNDAQNDAVYGADDYVRSSGVKSMMAVPIRRQEEALGALYLESRLATGAFAEDRVRLLQLLSTQMSIALENSRRFEWLEAEIHERRHAEARLRFIAEASLTLAAGIGVDGVLESLPRAAVPFLADWATVDVLTDEGNLRRASSEHADAGKRELLEELSARYSPKLGSAEPAAVALRTGAPVLRVDVPDPELRETQVDVRHGELLRLLGARSIIAVPLIARGRRVGALTLYAGGRRPRFGAGDVPLVQELAQRAAVSMDKARLESELSQSQKFEAIGRLSAGVAHDFNNFLLVVLAHADLLSSSTLEPEAAESVEQIRAAAQGATEVTRRLLAMGRQQILHPQRLRVNEFLQGSMDRLRGLAGARVDLVVELDSEVGEIEVDRTQLTQVVANLVTNARDAMPRGGTILIRTAETPLDGALQEAPGKIYVCISVSDTGVGMDSRTQSHLFEPFYTTKAQGTGIGLATIKGIVEQSGGKILVESRLGLGSRFTVCFPKLHD